MFSPASKHAVVDASQASPSLMLSVPGHLTDPVAMVMQVWPSKMIRHIAESFMKCTRSGEVDAIREGVNATIVPVFQNRMNVEWGEIPLIA